MERVVFKKLPMAFLGGTLVPVLVSVFSHLFPPEGVPIEVAKRLKIVDYMALGFGMTAWTAVLTVAIGCLVVIVMKGPHYAADSYNMDGTHESGDEQTKTRS